MLGDNDCGELGDGTTNDASRLQVGEGLTSVMAVAAGYCGRDQNQRKSGWSSCHHS